MDDLERAIRFHVTPDDVVLDIGANRGMYTSLLAQLATQVYSFEPHPEIFNILRTNVAADNVTFIQKAVSDQSTAVDFYLDRRPGMFGVASSVHVLTDLKEQKMIERITVEATTVDAFCEAHALAPGFIKTDAEGHDPAVLRGATRTLEKHRPVLIFEFWESWWDSGYRELFDFLEAWYALVRIADGADALTHYRSNRGTGQADILAIPRRIRSPV